MDFHFKKEDIVNKLRLYFNKYFRSVIIVIVIIVFILGYFLVLKGQYEQIRYSTDVDLTLIDQNIERLMRDAEFVDRYIDQAVDFTTAEEELLATVLPSEFSFPSFVIQMEGLAKKQGMLVTDMSLLQAESISANQGSGLQMAHIDVVLASVGSDYSKFKSLLDSMETSLMVFDINSVSFGTFTGTSNQYKINLTTYYYPDK